MAYEFKLPDIGEGLTEATVVRWLIELGTDVAMDQPMVEVETDKAVVEIPAPRPGFVLHLGAAEGATIAVGDVLIVIGDRDEKWLPRVTAPLDDDGVGGSESKPQAAPIVGTLEEAATVLAPTGAEDAGPTTARSSVRALPLVRRLAAASRVDLADVDGTGRGGRITRSDVESAAAAAAKGDRVKMSPMRLAIARNMARSWREIPHVTTYGEAGAEPLLAARSRMAVDLGITVPLEALLMSACVPLLREYPDFNATVDGDAVVYYSTYDIGFAVDTLRGLLVAVVRSADERSVGEVGTEINRLAAAARARTITADEMKGATFTISNIGAVGGRFGTPIIPFGTSAVLSVGRADLRPIVRDGEVVAGREFPLSLSYDHRVIDGAMGRRFMGGLIESIER